MERANWFHKGPFDPQDEHIIICLGYALSMNQTPFLHFDHGSLWVARDVSFPKGAPTTTIGDAGDAGGNQSFKQRFFIAEVMGEWAPDSNDTVGGRNPAPVDMVNFPLLTGFCTSQVVVLDFFTINSITCLQYLHLNYYFFFFHVGVAFLIMRIPMFFQSH